MPAWRPAPRSATISWGSSPAALLGPDSRGAEVGVSVSTLERWHSEALAQSPGKMVWTAAARFDALLVTAAMDESAKAAWCRANGVYLKDLQAWRESATQGLGAPGEIRASPNQIKQDQRRIKELERDLRRKNAALAETTALLVLSKNSRRSSATLTEQTCQEFLEAHHVRN